MKIKYDRAESNINKICKVMEEHQVTLLKDAAMLDKMYDLNLNYFKELSMYILAGKQKLEQARTVELPALLKKAEQADSQKRIFLYLNVDAIHYPNYFYPGWSRGRQPGKPQGCPCVCGRAAWQAV